MAEPCPFCRLGDRVLRETGLAVAFLSNPRLVPCHTLVVPKRHVEVPWQLTTGEVVDISVLVQTVQKILVEQLGVAGCDTIQRYRPFVAEGSIKVNHLHVHVLPRSVGDNIGFEPGAFEPFTDIDTTIWTTLEAPNG